MFWIVSLAQLQFARAIFYLKVQFLQGDTWKSFFCKKFSEFFKLKEILYAKTHNSKSWNRPIQKKIMAFDMSMQINDAESAKKKPQKL